MPPFERLMAEELPTGTFGDAPRTPTRRRTQPADADHYTVANPTSPTVAAEHYRVLEAALNGWAYDEPARDLERRHLRLLTDQQAA
ncbi:hypothetical protein AB0B07_33330 [Streptomyces sioyaensis]|uniref:hypothetical protein n=1 Tax=Streptomyces sioyaensis TaxID=67364 RepID=UPI0033C607B3